MSEEKALASALREWTDFDGAMFEIGKVLGVFPEAATWDNYVVGGPEMKWIFWSRNAVGDALNEVLAALTKATVLEQQGLQFRARRDFKVEEDRQRPLTNPDTVRPPVPKLADLADALDDRAITVRFPGGDGVNGPLIHAFHVDETYALLLIEALSRAVQKQREQRAEKETAK